MKGFSPESPYIGTKKDDQSMGKSFKKRDSSSKSNLGIAG